MTARWLAWLIIAASVAFGAWIFTVRYAECRAHGFSVFYCATSR